MKCCHGPLHRVPSRSSTLLWCSLLPTRRWTPRTSQGMSSTSSGGKRSGFRSVEVLFAFMAARLCEVHYSQTSPEEETEERHLQDQGDRKGDKECEH
jgi:hypothetical protein